MGIFQRIFGGAEPEPLPDPAVLIDVRSPAEFAGGHVQGALLLPLPELGQGIARAAPDKSAPVIVYCQSGGRAAAARQQLQAMGYQHVVNGGGARAVAERLQRPLVAG